MRTGLNSALDNLPIDGSVEITVVRYSSGTTTVVSPTVLTAASLSGIKNSILTHSKLSGSTATHSGITSITSELTGSVNFSDPGTRSLINLLTDGAPNSQASAEAAALAAAAAGIDALSIEAIGNGVSSAAALANMLAMTFPNPAQILAVNETNIPNPINGSWVVPVSDFNALAAVLDAKVQASVPPPPPAVPEPSTMALFTIGLLEFNLTSRKKKLA